MQRIFTPIIGLALLIILIASGCSSDKKLDQHLRSLINEQELNAPFIADTTSPSDILAELGSKLFFSPDLSIDGSVSCASCHHPSKAGTDGIALPIGIGGVDSRNIGQERLDAARKSNPELSLEGLIPRNAPTVLNSALFRKALFWDGRVQYHESVMGKKIVAGIGATQNNPSNYLQENLLQTQARMPMGSNFEMKGQLKPNLNGHEIEQDILNFLQSQKRWCVAFAQAFGIKPCDEIITLTHLTRALAAFEATLIMTDSPFQRYIKGDDKALTTEQKRGAIAFLSTKEQGGVGCVNCHSGTSFSSEGFYNINIPPSGRGANDNGWDLGRHNVDRTAERFSFRVPHLLNVEHTAPYFHNGVAPTLEDAIRFKQTSASVKKPAKQILLDGIDYSAITAAIHADFEKSNAKPLLPESLSESQISELAAFLRSLSDDCLSNTACTDAMVPEIIESPREQKADRPQEQTAAQSTPQSLRRSQPTAAPKLECDHLVSQQHNIQSSLPKFSRHTLDVGIDHERTIGLIKKGWLMDVVNYASVSATDFDYNCYDDLLFDAGEAGLVLYKQQKDGLFKRHAVPFSKPESAVNAMTMDLDGDYRFDMFVGNYGQASAAIVFDFQQHADDLALLTSLTGPVINATAGDINNDGYQDVVFGMWRSFSSFKQPHIWLNDGQGNLSANEGFIKLRQSQKHVGGGEQIKRQTTHNIGVSDLTFTPNLADIDGEGQQDLLLASDFFRSQVLKNQQGRLHDITDKTVIDDTNGMGAAVGDFDRNGTMDWFVTSIVDNTMPGLSRGHRLYMNQGGGVFKQAPIVNKDVEWSWGACTADFNNDGHLDLFYISGYGEPMNTARYETDAQREASENFLISERRYTGTKPTLLINNGSGAFSDESEKYGFRDVLDGRGVACFDYQQDGDMDIVVAPLEGSPVLYRNNQKPENQWLALRVIGLPGNTEAFGTQVILHTAKGKQYRQVRFENNYVSRNPSQLHFGLGDLDKVEKVEIKLPAPNEKTVTLTGLELNQLHVLYVSDLLAADHR